MIKKIENRPRLRLTSDIRLALILPRFNESIGLKLLAGAERAFRDQGGKDTQLTLVRVPGSFEIPLTAQKLIETKCFDAIIALGVLVKGETFHFDAVWKGLVDGIRSVMLQTGVPIIFEVLTVDRIELAQQRAQKNPIHNKGYSALLAALAMVHVVRKIQNFKNPQS